MFARWDGNLTSQSVQIVACLFSIEAKHFFKSRLYLQSLINEKWSIVWIKYVVLHDGGSCKELISFVVEDIFQAQIQTVWWNFDTVTQLHELWLFVGFIKTIFFFSNNVKNVFFPTKHFGKHALQPRFQIWGLSSFSYTLTFPESIWKRYINLEVLQCSTGNGEAKGHISFSVCLSWHTFSHSCLQRMNLIRSNGFRNVCGTIGILSETPWRVAVLPSTANFMQSDEVGQRELIFRAKRTFFEKNKKSGETGTQEL